jgi:GPH family glycoside/pentoside/hexuronide:cation symporter
MITYSTGDCANSLILNSLFGFAMLYYTDALGLKPSLAGIAMSVAIFWDAISDPVMGHISDNTRSKFGRRHPYMLIGGLCMVASFYFLWSVPDIFKSSMVTLFWYLVAMNLLLRTTFTVFIIPYTALGFEMCTDYTGRTKLQGIRTGMNMATNFCGPALSWAIFFQNKGDIRATSVPANFISMGTVFTAASLFFVLFVFFSTLRYLKDSRNIKLTGNSIKGFFVDMKEIILDKYPRWVFAFIFVVILGIALVSSLQMYLYEHFMKFSGNEKSIAHGSTMLGMGLGALFASVFVRHFDKKGAVFIAVLWSVFCNVALAVLFLPGIFKPGQTFNIVGFDLPIPFIVFVFFHGSYWLGNGIMVPIATSMMADVSEIHEIKTGINKDGGYSAVFSFAMKMAMSAAAFISGYCLTMIGFATGKGHTQTADVVWRLCAVTLLAGPLISLIALVLIKKYPVNSEFIENIRAGNITRE